MNFSFSKEYILFSPISGYIIIDGKPISNLTVNRWFKWWFYGEEKTEETTTDLNGYFSFSKSITVKSFIIWIIPHEAVITQKLLLDYNNETIQIYGTVKRNYEPNWEYWGKPLEFIFDPTKKKVQYISFTPIPSMPDFTQSISILSWEKSDKNIWIYGNKMQYEKWKILQFPDFTIEYLWLSSIQWPNNAKFRMESYSFKIEYNWIEQVIIWSPGTGDIWPTRFKCAGHDFILEKYISEKVWKLLDNEIVISQNLR